MVFFIECLIFFDVNYVIMFFFVQIKIVENQIYDERLEINDFEEVVSIYILILRYEGKRGINEEERREMVFIVKSRMDFGLFLRSFFFIIVNVGFQSLVILFVIVFGF